MKYNRIYHMLCTHGHSAQHASDIIIEAKRNQRFALNWIRRAHAMVPFRMWVARKAQFNDPILQLRKIARR